MPTAVIGILIGLAVIAVIGGIIAELINKICIILMSIVFIISSIILKQQITQPLFDSGNWPSIIYIAIHAGVGVLFTAPYFIPSIERRTFSIGNLIVNVSDYRAGLGICLFGATVCAIISSGFLAIFLENGIFIFFILPSIVIGAICIIYSIILIVGTVKGW